MSREIEILPVTSNEVVRILGSLNIEELEHLLDEIRMLRKQGAVDKKIMFERRGYILKTSLIVSE